MKFHPLVASALLLFAATVSAQPAATPTPSPAAANVTVLWPAGAPGKLGDQPQDIPTLTAYLPAPESRTGASMLILPGGGYSKLAEHEGVGYAEWFTQHGIVCYVLKYRLGSSGYRHPAMLQDAARALRQVRAWARRDGLDPARVGVIGSSAGGHLASTLVTHFDAGQPAAADPIERESSRPDLGILCYPVITMGDNTHAGSRKNLLGDNPAPELVELLSNEKQVTSQTPPCYVWSTGDDKVVKVENTLRFVDALRRAGVPFDLHIFEKGPHGLGFGRPGKPAPPWADSLLFWLRARQFVK
ncbi:MAG: alpha/beta hydrolase [Opitutae bacterium]|nr:alpha/beta hydrolase [Opitutae bacterium]